MVFEINLNNMESHGVVQLFHYVQHQIIPFVWDAFSNKFCIKFVRSFPISLSIKVSHATA